MKKELFLNSYRENEVYDECDLYADYDEDTEIDAYADCDCFEDNGCEWTEEDSWDALTDGMYGDMPSNPLEYDAMMDAMGF